MTARIVLIAIAAALAGGETAQSAAAKPPSCAVARATADAYKDVAHRYQTMRGAHPTPASTISRRAGCRYVSWAARLWQDRAWQAKRAYRRLPLPRDWRAAARVAQRVYPGTFAWLMSCSAAESRHGAWVRYGGLPYYPGFERYDIVGGYMQFRPSTFYGAARRSYDYLRAQHFRVPRDAVTGVRGWLSPLGQALAAGYLRAVAGSSGWHWKASVGNGC